MSASDTRPDPIQICARFAAWSLAAFIIFTTLSPIGLRPETGAPPSIERFTAFFVLSVAFGLGYPAWRRWAVVGLVLAAVLLEVAQELAPSRHGRVIDAAVKAFGALSGVAFAAALDHVRTRLAPTR